MKRARPAPVSHQKRARQRATSAIGFEQKRQKIKETDLYPQRGLQLLRRPARDHEAIAVAELDHRVAVGVRRNQRHRLFHRLRVREVVELDGVMQRVEVLNGLCAHARPEHEVIATADRGRRRGRIEYQHAGMTVRREVRIAVVPDETLERQRGTMATAARRQNSGCCIIGLAELTGIDVPTRWRHSYFIYRGNI